MDVHGLAALRLAARGSTKVVVRQSGSRHAGKEIIKPKLGGHAPKLGYSAVLAAYAARNRVDTEHAFSIELRRMNNAGDHIGLCPEIPGTWADSGLWVDRNPRGCLYAFIAEFGELYALLPVAWVLG